MIVPEHLASVLTCLQSAELPQVLSSSKSELLSFASLRGYWVGVLQYSSDACWMITPISKGEARGQSPSLTTADPASQRNIWKVSSSATDRFRDAVLNPADPEISNSIASQMHALGNEAGVCYLCIECTGFHLVAELLHHQGVPPAKVASDWRNQLATFRQSIAEEGVDAHGAAVPHCTTETLVTADGLLVPLSPILASVRAASITDPSAITCHKSTKALRVSWPWKDVGASKKVAIQTPLADSYEPAIQELLPVQTRRPTLGNADKKKKPDSRTKVAIGGVLAATCGIAIWFSTRDAAPDSSVATKVESPASSAKSTIAERTAKSSKPSSAPAAIVPESVKGKDQEGQARSQDAAELEIAEITTIESPSEMQDAFDGSVEGDAASETLESLLSSLNPKETNRKFSLASVNSASIISSALQDKREYAQPGAGAAMSQSNGEGDSIGIPSEPMNLDKPGNEIEPFQVNEEKGLEVGATSNEEDVDRDQGDAEGELQGMGSDVAGDLLPGSLTKTFVLNSANRKELVSFEQRLSPRLSRCEVSLKLSEGLVFEPAEPVTIEGVGSALWKIAIEDEEPEILLQIQSKPGARWQCIFQVAMRETSVATPVPLGPRDAQNVGWRLLEYNQWLNNSISTLQDAKAKLGRRSRFDFVGEIKKMERQQREVEQAIERWKVIARLSHLLFDGNEIQLTMHGVGIATPAAIGKPTE